VGVNSLEIYTHGTIFAPAPCKNTSVFPTLFSFVFRNKNKFLSLTSHRLCVPLGVMAVWRVTEIMRATVTTSLNSVGLVVVRMRAAVTGTFDGVGLAVLFSQRVAREVNRTYTYVHTFMNICI